MIYTVTFNPSLDYIVRVDDLKLGEVNRVSYENILPGGKGINVSIVLKNLGHDNCALGFTAGFTGAEIEHRLAEAGIDFHEEDSVVYSPFEEEREQSLAKICGQLRHYTAVFCVSDLYAVQLMGALYDRGIRVPEDISVAGFDDTLLGRSHRPALTTVRQDVEEKGVLAVKVIIGLLKGEEPKERDIRLPIHLVPRGSTASPGKKL